MSRRGFFGKKDLDVLQVAGMGNADTDIQAVLGKMITTKESAMAKLGSALKSHVPYFANLMNRKKELAARMFYKGGKLLAALVIGPAKKMANSEADVNDVAHQFFGNNSSNMGGVGNAFAIIDYTRIVPETNTTQANYNRVLTMFGGYRVKTTITKAIVSSLDWLDGEIKKDVGMSIPEEVVGKLKKPGLGPSEGNGLGNGAYDLGIAGLV